MNAAGPVVVIEDDADDREIFEDIFKELGYENEVLFFGDGVAALDFITTTAIEPFLILSDIVMPKLSGIELREKIYNNEDLRLKCIPYLFFSTTAEQRHVIDAYSKSIQGFFIKSNDYGTLRSSIKKIMEYWKECVSPNYIQNVR